MMTDCMHYTDYTRDASKVMVEVEVEGMDRAGPRQFCDLGSYLKLRLMHRPRNLNRPN